MSRPIPKLRVLAIVGSSAQQQVFVFSQIESLRQLGMSVDVWSLASERGPLKYGTGMLQALARVPRGRYDLVHGHYSFCGAVARCQTGTPVVVSYMGDDLLGSRDFVGRITQRSRLIVLMGRALSRIVDAVIVKSPRMRAMLGRSDVHVIPNGVDLELFRPLERSRARADLGLSQDTRYVLFASDPARPEKCYSLASAVMQLVRQRLPEAELLVLKGQPQQRLALAYNAVDALVLTSLSEGSPNVVKEAMATNLPVVSVDVGDVRELLHGATDCYVCSRDPRELADRLCDILLRQSRTNGRQAISRLALPAVAKRIAAVYEDVLDRRGCH